MSMGSRVPAWTLAAALGFATLGLAQNPLPPQPPQSPRPTPSDRPTAQNTERAVTVDGCLVREADVARRQPRARTNDDEAYVLTNVKGITGAVPPAGVSGLYEVDGIPEEQLAAYAGSRVQIDGVFEHLDRTGNRIDDPGDRLVQI